MFIVSRPQPSATKYSSAAAITSAAVRPGAYASAQTSKPRRLIRTDVADPLELRLALHRACEVELDVERHELEALERTVVADGHDVVEAVDADPRPACSARARRCGARPVDEQLLDQRGPVLADVARLGREDDERVAVAPERRRTRSGARSGSPTCTSRRPRSPCTRCPRRQRVELVLGHRGSDVGETTRELPGALAVP